MVTTMDRVPKALSQIFVPLVFMMTKWTEQSPYFPGRDLLQAGQDQDPGLLTQDAASRCSLVKKPCSGVWTPTLSLGDGPSLLPGDPSRERFGPLC